jgi:type I restriction enzyme S subunit
MEREAMTLPNGWAWTTIGEITQPIEKVDPATEPDKPFTYLDIASIDNTTQVIREPKAYYGANAPSRARQLVRANDVLFSTVRTYLKNIAQVPEAFDGQIASTGFSVLRGREGILTKCLFYFALTTDFLSALAELQRGTSYPAVRDGDVRAQPIPLAPLPEQHRIVAEIEKQFTRLDAGVAALKRVQANLKRYKASVLKAACEGKLVPQGPNDEPASELMARILEQRRKGAVTAPQHVEPAPPDTAGLPELPQAWCWTRLSNLIFNGPQNGLYLPKSRYGSGVPILRIDDFQNGVSRSSEELQQVNADTEDIERYSLREDDLIINRVNSPSHLGKCLVVSSRNLPAIFESNMMRIRLSELCIPKFVEAYLWSVDGRIRLTSNAKWAVNQASINQVDVGNTPVPLPPLAEQRRIVTEVERRLSVVQEVEAVIAANLARAERLRQSILKQAFEGKLAPQDPNDEPASMLLERIRAKATHTQNKQKT